MAATRGQRSQNNQRKRKPKISSLSQSLAIASSVLVGVPGPAAALEWLGDKDSWEASAGLLYYSETDRVTAIEPIISATKALDTDEYLSFSLTIDTLTGASATGAVPSVSPQTFTRPSGNGNYTTAQSETPLDDTFKDSRVTLTTGWTKPVRRNTTAALGAMISNEYDYQSLGVNTRFTQEINNKNTSLNLGLSVNFDSGAPVGGEPIPLSEMQPSGQAAARQGDGSDKQVTDVILGVTQIIDKNSLFQVNYSLSNSDGYLTDPYKVVSVVDSTTGDPLFQNTTQTDLPTVVYEHRPDSRLKQSLFFQYKRAFDTNVLDGSYRFLSDDWGIQSHTLDMRYRFAMNGGSYLEPHLRWYQQSKADFYTPFFTDISRPAANASHVFASADYRLGDFTGWTLGLEYGKNKTTSSWSFAAEYYLQTGDEPPEKFGSLNELTLYPDVDAFILRFIKQF